MIRSRSTWILALVLAGSSCAHQGPPAPRETTTVPAAAPAPATQATAATPQPAAARCTTDTDCASTELCVGAVCRAITPDLAECTAAVVHFSFDQHTLPAAELPQLQRAARCLANAAGLRVKIEGHADERGTSMYNLALGNRRAAAVQAYLVSLGAPPAQIETVSYGKERPICSEHDEGCWAQNRRARLDRGF